MPAAGRLRERLAFEARVVINDGAGNRRGEFKPRFVEPAAVQAKFGGEAVTAARLEGQQPFTIVVRYSSRTADITAEWQARDVRTGQVYAIVAPPVDPDGKRAWLEILAKTGVAS